MAVNDKTTEYVTATVAGQLFGIPISRVQDVFIPERTTRVPLAPPEVAGLINLRGRIVTAIDMRRRLGLPAKGDHEARMAIEVECKGEYYGLLIDTIGEVLKLANSSRENNPSNLDPQLSRVVVGVHRVDGTLMVVLEVDRLLDIGASALAA